jgi:RHS repeat-associated protein
VVVKNIGGAVLQETVFTYDVTDRRIGKWVDPDGVGPQPAVQLWTVYDGVNPYADFDGTGSLTTRYLADPRRPDVLFARVAANGTTAWYLRDNINSVRQVVSPTGTVLNAITYDSFGNVLSETNPAAGDRFKYTGREYDAELGIYYYRARYYDPATGRFLGEDPLGIGAGDPNFYRYVFNTPTIFTDPSGEFVPLLIAGAVLLGGVGGGIAGYSSGEGSSGIGSWMPGYGAGRNAGAAFRRGEYWSGGGYTLLAATDVFLLRSVAKNATTAYAAEGWRGLTPGWMTLYKEHAPFHLTWSATGKQLAPYYQAVGGTGRMRVLGTEKAGLAGLNPPKAAIEAKQWFSLPVLSTGMAGSARYGRPAFNCTTAPLSAWSAGTFHIVPYAGLHGVADGSQYLFSTADHEPGVVVVMPGVVEVVDPRPRNPMPPLDTIGKGGDPRFR